MLRTGLSGNETSHVPSKQGFCTSEICFDRLSIWLGDRVLCDVSDNAGNGAVLRKRECLQLDVNGLPYPYEPYVAVGQVGFDTKGRLGGNNPH
ncbi:hypothetical protein FHX09_000251 [Rhizobium sp. BK538]|nr:hypothetical protein [Rhizobium sp. BK538]